MTSTSATWAKGTTLSRDGNTIAELETINAPKPEMEMKIIKRHDADDDYVEKIALWKDGKSIDIAGHFKNNDTNGQIGLQSDFDNKTKQSFILTFPTSLGASWAFNAYVTNYHVDPSSIDDDVKFTATLEITGKPTLTLSTAGGLTTPFFAVSAGDVAPTAAADTYTYVVDVPNATSSVTITPTSTSTDSITVDGNTVESGEASSSIALTAGEIRTVEIVCTEANKADLTYTLYIVRAAA